MKKLLINIFALIFISLPTVTHAQGGMYYDNETSYGLMFQSKGWGLTFDYARLKPKYIEVYDVDFVSLKHPKEVRIVNGIYENPPPYVFGKLNKAYALRTGYGIKHYLGNGADASKIKIFGQLTGGPVFTFLKPVYLQIVKDRQGQAYVENERYDPEIHTDQSAIFGESAFGEGLGEMRTRVGLFVKASFGFEWSNYAGEFRCLSMGATIDAFGSRLPIMSKVENKSVFSTFFMSFAFGNKS